jgi:E3 ubiquitin-protein ligase SHPRH
MLTILAKLAYPLHLATRVMILTAVKEMNGKKGVSILSIYKYVSSIYRYDVQRNRSLLKRMLKCLIFEGLVKQIKGHGFSGTFTLGKNYKEEDICDKTKKQVFFSAFIQYFYLYVLPYRIS